MNNTDYDVVIIGGGPAGAAAGIHLSRAGIKTALIERKIFPRETLCGEFLSIEVTENLKSMHLFEKFLTLNPNKILHLQFITSKKTFRSNLPFEGFSIQRSIFDDFLLSEAKSSGVKIFQPAEVKEITKRKKNFNIVFKCNGMIENASSGFVIGAYGKSNVLDKKLKREFSKLDSDFLGLKFHIEGEYLSKIEKSSIYIFSGENIYCGMNMVSGGEAVVCFLVKNVVKDLSAVSQFQKLLEENKPFSSFFNLIPDLKKQNIYGAGNIYFGKKELVQNGIIMIGDAAKVIAPLAGDGIGMAFESAKLAADLIIECNNGIIGYMEVEQIYQKEWVKHFRKRTGTALLIQNLILRHRITDLIPGKVIQHLMPSIILATRN